MKGSKNYRVPKLKKSENYESWKKNIINVLKVKDLWMIISEKLKKSTSLSFNVSTADKKKLSLMFNIEKIETTESAI